ncbi:MAG: hypothetical protein A2900_02430 [Candidatus Chisholmbacteria bacterium RIFCSPLOWO2_01_FULL_50_28]|uniref:Steroid 5-alpha reductase C-terminal domain-containing protein n=1 Tax=Candidatus Chisholmbacteria bacterium RIFCSPHIGHO2_01_FULL_52_32 TaxID=1797591 RepID=A0A1G1VTI1_9BACT|nr:MAG: hypothetical protein A2786_04315 [Candidatus Chisholmbacteria bacterium RIFCSPHIGHO2_01_FULL_52_32]OGY19938.1 MAG: hypothetical protein A2900_02430 [Candidatus Chisholmbacteria bacterium RIFCSPLOWO2_01_FULL_50_28]
MGVALLLGQILFFLLLFLFCNLFVVFTSPFLVFLFLSGVAVGGLALLTMDRRSYSPLPYPRRHNVLVQKGIYRVLRHPLYTGLLLVGLSFLLSRFVIIPVIVYAAFAAVTTIKANMEEKLLMKMHPEYSTYRKRTKKFIPFVY